MGDTWGLCPSQLVGECGGVWVRVVWCGVVWCGECGCGWVLGRHRWELRTAHYKVLGEMCMTCIIHS